MVFLFQILIILDLLILVVGLIKPNWIMFWSRDPDRFMIIVFCTLGFMAAFTGYGEFLHREKEAEAEAAKPVFSHPAPLPRVDPTKPAPAEGE